jgi:hypothetical protein
MLCSVNELCGYVVAGKDDDVGRIDDVFFDDRHWTIRHLVVDTGNWWSGRTVLVSPHAVERVEAGSQRIVTRLTRDQIERGPDIDVDRPVSRQHDIAFSDYYGYPYWWAGAGLWGAGAYPIGAAATAGTLPMSGSADADATARRRHDSDDPNLRSGSEVSGYRIEARDGSIGHIDDFLFDDRSWSIRYAVVDTKNWWPGKHVLVAPQWIERVDWAERKAHFGVTREAVKSSTPYDKSLRGLSDDDEARLHAHYRGSPGL